MGKLTENNKKQTKNTLRDLFENKNAYSVDIKLNEEYTMTVYAKSLTDRDLTESVKTFNKELLEDNVNVDVFDSLDLVYHSDYLPLNTLTEKLLSKVCYDLEIKRNEEKLTESVKKPAKKKAAKKDKVRFVGNPEKEISMFNSFMGESYDADAPELQKLFELLPQLKGLTPNQLDAVAEVILTDAEEEGFDCDGDIISCLADYVIDYLPGQKGSLEDLSAWVDEILDNMDIVLTTDEDEGINSIPELKDLSREKLVELGFELFGSAVAVDDDDVIDALNELIKNHYDDPETINQVIYLAQELKDQEIAPRTEGEGEEELEEGRKRKYIEVRVLQGNYGSGWDDLCEYEIPEDWDEAKKVYKEIRDDYNAYKENEPQYSHRVVSRKKPINNTFKEEKSNTDENKGLKEDATIKIDPNKPKKEIEFEWELVKVDANGKETVLNKGSEEEINNLKSTTKDTPNEKFIVRKSEKVVEGYSLLGAEDKNIEAYSNYYNAKKRAEELGLKEAEYGDVYGEDIAYCFWNKSGDRNDDEEVMCYYFFGENGKPKHEVTETELKRIAKAFGLSVEDIDDADEVIVESCEGKNRQKDLKGKTGKLGKLKEEYGPYKDEDFCSDIADLLEDGYGSASVIEPYSREEIPWELEINGKVEDDFQCSEFFEYLCQDISYPVRDGHLNYYDLDEFLVRSFLDRNIVMNALKHDLAMLEGEDILADFEEWLKSDDEEFEFYLDFDTNFDADAYEEAADKGHEEDEESLEEDKAKRIILCCNSGMETIRSSCVEGIAYISKEPLEREIEFVKNWFDFDNGYDDNKADSYNMKEYINFYNLDDGDHYTEFKDDCVLLYKKGDTRDKLIKSICFDAIYDNQDYFEGKYGPIEESLKEDTVKQGNAWVNKGKEGTHGKFKTKKEADAQRKAMFAKGYKEGLEESLEKDFKDLSEKEIENILDKGDYFDCTYNDYDNGKRQIDCADKGRWEKLCKELGVDKKHCGGNEVDGYVIWLSEGIEEVEEPKKEGMKDRLDAYVKSLDKKEECLEESDGIKIFEVNFEVKNKIPPFEEMNNSQLVKANSEEDAIEKIIKKFGIARDKVNSAREVEIEENLTEAKDEKSTTFYSLELGVLLPEDDKEYDSYTGAFDKKHAFYDEEHWESLDEQELVNKATEYINAGVPGTYGIISKIEVENFKGIEDVIAEMNENGFIEESVDFFNGEQYDIENVVWCAYKNEDEELVNDFLELEEKPAEEVEVEETEVEEESLKEGSILYDIDYAEGPDSYAQKMDKVGSDLNAVKEKYKIETEYDDEHPYKFYNFELNGKDVSIVFYSFNGGLQYDYQYVLVNGEKLDNDKLSKLETSRGGDLGDYYALEPTIKAIQLYIEQEFKESLEESAGSMKDKVERSTQNYTKPKGAIQCNKGAQADEVVELLKKHYSKVEVVPVKKTSVQVKYMNEGLEEAWGDYKAYDKEEGWTDADIELHKNTDWKARNYEVLPTEDEYVGDVHLVGGDKNGTIKDVKFHKVIRSNPIFPPYYKPDEDYKGYLGPMFDGEKHNGIDIHNRYETQEVYDALSEAKEEKPEEEKETEKWTRTFEEFLDLIEFELVKNGKKWALHDLQGANLGDIESETFENAAEILDRLDIYIGDYILDALAEIIEDFDGTENLVSCEDYLNWYNTIGKEKYADELADSSWDFEVLDMIVNHGNDIDLEEVYHENDNDPEEVSHEIAESLKEAYRGKDFDDYMRCLKILGYGSSDLERIKNENNFDEQELLNYLRKEAEEKGDK